MRSGRRELFRRAARRGRLVRPLRLRAAVERDRSAWPAPPAAPPRVRVSRSDQPSESYAVLRGELGITY